MKILLILSTVTFFLIGCGGGGSTPNVDDNLPYAQKELSGKTFYSSECLYLANSVENIW